MTPNVALERRSHPYLRVVSEYLASGWEKRIETDINTLILKCRAFVPRLCFTAVVTTYGRAACLLLIAYLIQSFYRYSWQAAFSRCSITICVSLRDNSEELRTVMIDVDSVK